jgi:ubiquinone/menaquinone biosynthesis C-methylase UbiE
VHTVAAIEPSAQSLRLARSRMALAKAKIVHVGLDGQSLDLDDGRCDGALCTFTLCTVGDPNLVLREIHRVLRSGATLHFLEHGVAPLAAVERWQWRLDPFQRRLAGGCRLTRDPVTMIEQSGLEVEVLEQRFASGPKPWAYFTLGRATKR